jgi:uncharacterized RDD family membrane protein YckC
MARCIACGLEQAHGAVCRACGKPLPQSSLFGFTPTGDEVNPYASPQSSGSMAPPFGGQSPLAGRGARLGAKILDGLMHLAVCIPGIVMMAAGGFAFGALIEEDVPNLGGPLAIAGIVVAILAFLGFWIYQIVLLSTSGQTLGKKIVGIRIVTNDSEEYPGFVKAFLLRDFVNDLISNIPYIGSLYALVDILFIFGEERRCIHDLIAGTKVVEASAYRAAY